MPIPSNMFNRLHIDLTGPFKENGIKCFIIGATDALTKYMIGGIIPTKDAQSVVTFIKEEIINKYGVPNIIATDRGNEFHNNISKNMAYIYGITRIRTASYHPTANGEIERRWRFIKDFIKKNCGNDYTLKDILPRAIFAINGVINSTTGYAPHYLVYGRLPDTPTNYTLLDNKQVDDKRTHNMRHYNAIENENTS